MIAEFFEGCEIFITGGSGTVGRGLIEKLLRSCKVRRIYLLLRVKRNLGVQERLEKLRKDKIFQVLHKTMPDELNKLVAIPGDAVLPNLGITPAYATMLANVSIVFHCAATVRFDEAIRVAVHLNVGATLEALKFAETLKNLKCFMHVSTFYCNTYLEYVDAKVYEPPMDWRLCLKMIKDEHNQDALDYITKKMITGFPNTYTFTKNLAESLVNEYSDRLPVCIYRPSIVLHSLREPVPGFPPTIMGAMGLFVLVGAGLLKTVYMSPETRFDITPLDLGIKNMLYYTYRADKAYKSQEKVESAPVYQSSSCCHSQHTFLQMCETMEIHDLWYKAAFEKCFMIPSCVYTSSRLIYMFLLFTKQVLPAMLVDSILVLSGRKPALMGIIRKAYVSLEVMKPFLFNTYVSPGFTLAEDMFADTQGTEFALLDDVTRAGTDEGLQETCATMVYRIRDTLLKEDPKTIPKMQKVLKVKIFVYNVLRAIFAYYVLRYFYRILANYISDNYA